MRPRVRIEAESDRAADSYGCGGTSKNPVAPSDDNPPQEGYSEGKKQMGLQQAKPKGQPRQKGR